MDQPTKRSSASYVVEFARGRAELEAKCRKVATDRFKAPEVIEELVRGELYDAFDEVTAEERRGLDRVRGNGIVDWKEVVRAFQPEGGSP